MLFLDSEFSLEEILNGSRRGMFADLVKDFLATDRQVVRLNFAEMDSASKNSVQNGVNTYVKRNGLSVKCVIRSGDLYLINPNGSIKRSLYCRKKNGSKSKDLRGGILLATKEGFVA